MPITARAVRTIRTTFFIFPNDSERSRPPRLGEEIRDKVGDLLDTVYNIGSTVLIGIGFIGPVNNQPFAHNELARNEAPVPAVGAVVAIVAHREIVIGWDNDLPVFGELFVPIWILIRAVKNAPGMRLRREEITKRIGVRTRRALMNLVGLIQRHVVDEYLLVDDLQMIARESDGTLDVMLGKVLRILEHDHVAVLDGLEWKNRIHHGTACPEDKLVDQQMVADQEIVFHRRRRDLERLHNECGAEERENDSDDQRFEILAGRRFLESRFTHKVSTFESRPRACRAAACSAAFFVRPSP